jgi:hypothetical protein
MFGCGMIVLLGESESEWVRVQRKKTYIYIYIYIYITNVCISTILSYPLALVSVSSDHVTTKFKDI